MREKEKLRRLYEKVLVDYVEERTEHAEHKAQMLSKRIIKNGISPEELGDWQKEALEKLYPDMPADFLKVTYFFMEMIKNYDVVLRETEKLRLLQQQVNAEMEIAASVQSTLLGTTIPKMDGLEIGAISIPARRVSGDYFHFVPYENGSLGVGLADVMGKGLPAALCISMMKYAIDHNSKDECMPNVLLEKVNEMVGENVDESMLISMVYGLYKPLSNRFMYASAGHEPVLYYNARSGDFEELPSKGLLFGVNKHTKYQLFEKEIDVEDVLILVSDGVTESRIDGEFIKKEFLLEEFRKNINLHPQEMAMRVCKHLMKLQNFKLRDDFTVIILKRVY